MGHQTQASFTLQDLGLLMGPPVKSFDAVVSLASRVLNTPKVALMMVDVENGSVFLRASIGFDHAAFPMFGYPICGSIAGRICEINSSLQNGDVSNSNLANAVEAEYLGAESFLGTPVHDPAGAPVGALIALHTKYRAWTNSQIEALETFAYLASQQIMLKASFETLRLMKKGIPLA